MHQPLTVITGVLTMALLNSATGAPSSARIRMPAVAGQFYPANAKELRADVGKYLAVKTTLTTPPHMLVSAHAGYIFSGPVAGRGFAEIDRATKLVILIGPSHRKWFTGVSIPDVDSFRTPLGDVALAGDVISQIRKSPVVNAEPGAHAQEHCLEVQLPFLQVLLPHFRIVPMVVGDVEPSTVAGIVAPHLGPGVLVVASSDFSHYHPDAEARAIDKASIDAILAGNPDANIDACGQTAIRVVMLLAKQQGLSPVLLDARNSSQTAPVMYKDPSRVVGYASIAYVKKAGKP
jgi:hypothetical protein